MMFLIIAAALGTALVGAGVMFLTPGSPRRRSAARILLVIFISTGTAFGLILTANLTVRARGAAFAFLTAPIDFLSRWGEWIYHFATSPPSGFRLILAGGAAALTATVILHQRKNIRDAALAGVALVGGMLAVTAWGTREFPLYWTFCAIATAAVILPALRESGREDKPPSIGRREALIGLGAAVVLAVILRFYLLDRLPEAFLDYEGTTGLSAVEVLEGNRAYHRILWSFHARPIMNTYSVPFFIFPLAGLFRVFGVNLITLRSLAALIGVLTVPVLYLLVARFASRLTALLAASVLAISNWHIAISRAGLALILTPLYAIVIGYWLLRAFQTRKLRYYVLSGLALGGYWLFYMVGKVMLLVAASLVIHQVATRRGYLRRHWPGLAALLLSILLLAFWSGLGPADWLTGVGKQGPNFIWNRTGPDSAVTPRVDLHWTWKYFLENVQKSFRYLFIRSHREFLLMSKLPYISPLLFPFFVIGFFSALAGWKRPLNFFFIALFFAAFIPRVVFAVFQDKASPRHLMLLIPPFAYFTARPFALLGNCWSLPGKIGGKAAAALLIAVPVLAAALGNFYVTFTSPYWEYRVLRMRREAAEFIDGNIDEYYFYVVRVPGPLYLQNRIIDFITYPRIGALHYHLTDDYPRPGQPGAGVTAGYRYIDQGELPGILDQLGVEIPRAGFIFEPLEQEELVKLFEERFGEGSVRKHCPEYAPWVFSSFLYPLDPVADFDDGG